MWFVYIVECADSSLYTGITLDVARRVKEHNSLGKGAKSVRYKRPVRLVYQEVYDMHRDAAKREYVIKQLKREAKVRLISGA
jgi:putative endonuclease